MISILKKIFVFALVVFISGCNYFKDLSQRSKLLLQNDEKLFRGFHFDIKIEEVKGKETASLEEETTDYLRYRIDADSIQSKEYIELEYFFNSNGKMDWLIGFYSLRSRADIQPMMDELIIFFDKKYGTGMQDELGGYHWEFPDETGEPGRIEINLIGETEDEYLGVELEMLKFYDAQ